MSQHLDRWNDDGVRFVFGYDANPTFVKRAENMHPNDYEQLVRKADHALSSARKKQPRVKEEIVDQRGYLNKRGQRRVRAQAFLGQKKPTALSCCASFRARYMRPVNTLNANLAYMLIASLAWTLKAWSGLRLPVSPRWKEMHEAERDRIRAYGCGGFVQRFI